MASELKERRGHGAHRHQFEEASPGQRLRREGVQTVTAEREQNLSGMTPFLKLDGGNSSTTLKIQNTTDLCSSNCNLNFYVNFSNKSLKILIK